MEKLLFASEKRFELRHEVEKHDIARRKAYEIYAPNDRPVGTTVFVSGWLSPLVDKLSERDRRGRVRMYVHVFLL